MLIVPIHIADVVCWDRAREPVYQFTAASFDPIAATEYPNYRTGGVRTVNRGELPRAWVRLPALAKLVERPHVCLIHEGFDVGGKVVLLSGEKVSGRSASVVLWLAKRGEQGFSVADGPDLPGARAEIIHGSIQAEPPAETAKPRRTVEVYEAPLRLYHRGRQINAWRTFSFAPIAGRRQLDADGIFCRLQEGCLYPVGVVAVPDGAEVIGDLLRLAPDSPPPWLCAEGLVLAALSGTLGCSIVLRSVDWRDQAPARTAPIAKAVVKADGLVVEDKAGQTLFAWADSGVRV